MIRIVLDNTDIFLIFALNNLNFKTIWKKNAFLEEPS